MEEGMIDLGELKSKVTEKEIMEFYWGESLINDKAIYKNPMRYDAKGTCYFSWYNGSYIFYDRSRGYKSNFNCFQYVMWLNNCSFYECLYKINSDMNLGLVGKYKISKKNRRGGKKYIENKTQTRNPKQKPKSKVKYKVKLRKFNEKDEEYWTKFGITQDTLNKFNLYPCKKYYSTSKFNNKFIRKYEYKTDDPCYVYTFKNNNDYSFKFYRPLTKNRVNKWKSNVSRKDIFGYSLIEEYDQPELFIASSGKDAMCLYEMGYQSIAPQSESSFIPFDIIEELSKKYKIYIIFDNDETGIEMSEKFSSQYNLHNIILPKYESLKDIAEFVETIGLEETKTIIENGKAINRISTYEQRTADHRPTKSRNVSIGSSNQKTGINI